MVTGPNLKAKGPSYDRVDRVCLSKLAFPFFSPFNLVLVDALAPRLQKPNDLRPASSPSPPPTHPAPLLLLTFGETSAAPACF